MLDDTREETVSQSGNGEPGTKDAEALAAALNHSAERVQTLWFSFLTFMLYLAIATGTTTHRMLFLESPLNLPVLNIALPLLGFYILTPIIFVVFHFYMLLNLVLLARTAKSFEDALARTFPEDGEARENFRMRIENTLFVQLLVGGRLEREGINAKFLSLMALITLALAPVALLLMFEVKFLPYHSEWITWLHRGLLALDLALVWTLWPGYRSGWGERLRPKASLRLALPGVLSAVALAYAVLVVTFPDERMFLATNWLQGGSTYFDPEVGWFPELPGVSPVNTLNLRGEDLISDEKPAHILEKNESSTAQRWTATLSLKDRDLTGANLSAADVRDADFSFAILNRANLSSTWAKKAKFFDAKLQGAWLRGAQLQGASLEIAEASGAQLDEAWLQGAYLGNARLQGASLAYANLQGAYLGGARLRGASLAYAQLLGASLESADLQGASLAYANLQGAYLGGAHLEAASFSKAFVWRADARRAIWKDTLVDRPETGPKGLCFKGKERAACDWGAAAFEDLKRFIAEQVPKLDVPQEVLERLEWIKQGLDPDKAVKGEEEMAKIWATRVGETPAPKLYEESVAKLWLGLGCAAEGAPYVLHGLVFQLSGLATRYLDRDTIPRIPIKSDAAKARAAAFLDEAHCPGAHGLFENDKETLKEIAAPAAPLAPKP